MSDNAVDKVLETDVEVLENQPFDEAHPVDDATDVESILADTPQPGARDIQLAVMDNKRNIDTPPSFDGGHDDVDYDDSRIAEDDLSPDFDHHHQEDMDDEDANWQQQKSVMDKDDIDLDADDGLQDNAKLDSEADPSPIVWEGAYDPDDFRGLPVSGEIKDLFDCITRYTPVVTDISTKLEPFIPDYIPAVGDIDAMIKIPRLDGVDLGLGYLVVDEPCAAQSEPNVLDLKLRSISKTVHKTAVQVKQVEDVPNNTKTVDNWITSITELRRAKPPQSIQYSKPMPDINLLMQEWPAKVEELLKTVELPGADLDVELKTYVSIVCAILDIPIHRSKIEALHLLFSLYVEFKNSQYFRTDEEKQVMAKQLNAQAETGAPDVLEL